MASISISHTNLSIGDDVNLTAVGTHDWWTPGNDGPPSSPRVFGSSQQKLLNRDRLLDGFDWITPTGGANYGTDPGSGLDMSADASDSMHGTVTNSNNNPGMFTASLIYGFRQMVRADNGTRTLHIYYQDYFGNVEVRALFADGSFEATHNITGASGGQNRHVEIVFAADLDVDMIVTVIVKTKVGSGDGLGNSAIRVSGVATSLDGVPTPGGGAELEIILVSPTEGAAPGTAGGFPLNKRLADATPVVLHVIDPSPGSGRFAVITVDAGDRREVVYWGSGFVRPYISGSAQRETNDDDGDLVLELSVLRDDGWPRPAGVAPRLVFRGIAFDGDIDA